MSVKIRPKRYCDMCVLGDFLWGIGSDENGWGSDMWHLFLLSGMHNYLYPPMLPRDGGRSATVTTW